jgi:hypothetical protein
MRWFENVSRCDLLPPTLTFRLVDYCAYCRVCYGTMLKLVVLSFIEQSPSGISRMREDSLFHVRGTSS